jgi:hypothetical protein
MNTFHVENLSPAYGGEVQGVVAHIVLWKREGFQPPSGLHSLLHGRGELDACCNGVKGLSIWSEGTINLIFPSYCWLRNKVFNSKVYNYQICTLRFYVTFFLKETKFRHNKNYT